MPNTKRIVALIQVDDIVKQPKQLMGTWKLELEFPAKSLGDIHVSKMATDRYIIVMPELNYYIGFIQNYLGGLP